MGCRAGVRVMLVVFPLLTVVALACGSIRGRLAPPEAAGVGGALRAGAARADLTPIPGYSMGGYAIGARIARGSWVRLKARALAIEDETGRRFCFVGCDLWSMPGGLADRAVELARDRYGAVGLGREDVVVAATHTHQSPGNCSTASFYNAFASAEVGFDRRLFDFFAHRIAACIGAAFARLEPADLTWARSVEVGVTRNRSLRAFETNHSARAIVEAARAHHGSRPTPATDYPVPDPDAYFAVEPTLHVVVARRRGPAAELIGCVSVFPVHPTVMGPDTEVYNADLFGIAALHAEAALAGEGSEPTVVMLNGAEGDVAANWNRQDRLEALRLGRRLGDAIAERVRGALTPLGTRVIPAAARRPIDRERPFVGAPIAGGAEADWSFLHDAGFCEGDRELDASRWVRGHDYKRFVLADDLRAPWRGLSRAALLRALEDVVELPEQAWLATYRIGPIVIATLPGEFTTALGHAIRERLARKAGVDESAVILVGLANEYVSYFTTPEEHDAQHYEGASTVYGRESGLAIGAALEGLLDGTDPRIEPLDYCHRPGIGASFGPRAFDLIDGRHRLTASFYSLRNVLADASGGAMPDYPRLVVVDDDPRWGDPGDVEREVTPRVTIERRAGDGGWETIATDDGVEIVASIVASFRGKSRWIVHWLRRPHQLDPEATYRMSVEGLAGTFRRELTRADVEEREGFVGLLRKPTEERSRR